jgi:8-oxo-dGTP diphosphatase
LLVGRNGGARRFYLPGGGREAGETDLTVLSREVTEELGVTLDLSTAEHLATYVAERDGRDASFVFLTYTATHAGAIVASDEVEELRWVTSEDADLVTDAERQLMTTLVSKNLID